MNQSLMEKWSPVIDFLKKESDKGISNDDLLSCSQELEIIREKYLSGEFKEESTFSMTDIYSPETERFYKEIKNCIEKFSNEKENQTI